MRKYFPCLRWKNIPYAPLLLLLLIASMSIKSVSAALPHVSVEPPTSLIAVPGANKTVEVVINGVSDFYGADFWLQYNASLLNKIAIDEKGPFPSGNPPTIEAAVAVHPTGYALDDLSVDGSVRISLTYDYSKVGDTSFNGTGTLVAITFQGEALGLTNLTFLEAAVKIWKLDMGPPPHAVAQIRDPSVNGMIEVVPEFPATIIVPLLLIATLAAASLGKMFWSRKRRGPATE